MNSDNFTKAIGAIVIGLLTVCFAALLSGTILWFIYDSTIPVMFPRIVENGYLAANLSWWQAVKITWIFGILIKATQTNNNK